MKIGSIRLILYGAAAVTLLAAQIVIARPQQITTQPLERASSLAAFERIKKLDGVWGTQSTKGWEEQQQIRVIAKGTAVAFESVPGAYPSQPATAPNAPMLTVYHMDGDRLLLTHYCEAGSQPRMVATSIEDGGRTVHFSFLDASNLPSPAAGHMHAVVLTLIDDNNFLERWSWYQDGKEQWTETVHNERATASNHKP
jgi:hypothetical protein